MILFGTGALLYPTFLDIAAQSCLTATGRLVGLALLFGTMVDGAAEPAYAISGRFMQLSATQFVAS